MHAVGRFRAIAKPMAGTVLIQDDALGMVLRQEWVEGADFLDKAPIAGERTSAITIE